MSFSYGGVHASEYGIRLLDLDRGVLPPTRQSEIVIPGRHGALDAGVEFDKRIISMECGIVAADQATLAAKVREIAAWLRPLEGAQRLIFGDEPDKYWMARYGGQVPLETALGLGRFSLQMICHDPFAYAVEDDMFMYGSTGTHTFVRRGTAPSYPLIEITGASGGGSQTVTVALNGDGMTYSGPLGAGETLVLDSDAMTVYRETPAGRVNGLGYIDSLRFGVAAPGTNELTVTTVGGATVTQVSIACRSRWY